MTTAPSPDHLGFGGQARALIEPYIDPAIAPAVRAAFEELERSLERAGATWTVGRFAYDLAVALGARASEASMIGGLLDVLQAAIDVSDNIADDPIDREAGLGLSARYPGIPLATLVCLPPIFFGCVFTEMVRAFPEPERRAFAAARRLSSVLAAMAAGQGLAEGHPERNALISGRQGLLLCLPVWLGLCHCVNDSMAELIERWAEAYGLLWQLAADVREKGTREESLRFEAAVEAARAVWPPFPPFDETGSFSARRLLPPLGEGAATGGGDRGS